MTFSRFYCVFSTIHGFWSFCEIKNTTNLYELCVLVIRTESVCPEVVSGNPFRTIIHKNRLTIVQGFIFVFATFKSSLPYITGECVKKRDDWFIFWVGEWLSEWVSKWACDWESELTSWLRTVVWETNSFSGNHGILHRLWTPKRYFSLHKVVRSSIKWRILLMTKQVLHELHAVGAEILVHLCRFFTKSFISLITRSLARILQQWIIYTQNTQL